MLGRPEWLIPESLIGGVILSDSRNAREHGSTAYLESPVVLAFGAFGEELE